MCNFFSFVTNPDNTSDFYYFDSEQRKKNPFGADSHSHICAYYKINEDKCNKYEYNPLTDEFVIDMQNAKADDSTRAERWVKSLDFKTIVEEIIIKPVINPLTLPTVDLPTEEQIGWLKEWRSLMELIDADEFATYYIVSSAVAEAVGAELWEFVWDVIWDSIGENVRSAIWTNDTIAASAVWRSVRNITVAYASSFFDIDYGYDFSAAVKLFESGLVPACGGATVWLLYSGTEARSVYELR